MDWGYLVPVVALHPLLEHVQYDVVLQSEHLMGDLVLVVPQLEHLLVGWALVVVQQVPHGADLGDNMGNLYVCMFLILFLYM